MTLASATHPSLIQNSCGPELLSFAGIPPAEVPARPLEQHVAEKVHAYTRSYVGGRPSTRVKDLIDLVMISSLFDFQTGRVSRALQAIFAARSTHTLPASLPPPPAQWRAAYRRTAAVKVFLDPILASAVPDDTRWNPEQQTW